MIINITIHTLCPKIPPVSFPFKFHDSSPNHTPWCQCACLCVCVLEIGKPDNRFAPEEDGYFCPQQSLTACSSYSTTGTQSYFPRNILRCQMVLSLFRYCLDFYNFINSIPVSYRRYLFQTARILVFGLTIFLNSLL